MAYMTEFTLVKHPHPVWIALRLYAVYQVV